LPTIEYLLRNRAKVIIITHLGKPDGEIIPQLSTIPLAQELAKLLKRKVYATDHVIHPLVPEKIQQMGYGEVLVLGNLRWHPEEELDSEAFARDLASYADIYINDAFGVSHRAHASVDAITKYLPSYAGYLLEAEVTTLSLLLKDPVKPFVLIMGGAKIKDKTGLMNNLAERADKILVGGAIGNTFLAASGQDVSDSLYEPEMIDKCQMILQRYGQKIILPLDSIKEERTNSKFSIMDIGLKTIETFRQEILKANTVFWNGNLGYSEKKPFDEGTRSIAQAMMQNRGTTVVSGGDTVGFVDINNLMAGINFISTGGGATLEFLAGVKMPGIEALNRAQNSITK
jgi:3-phosphoglycerate kinase